MSDPRAILANARVAHVSLEGRVAAPRFAESTRRRVLAPVAGLYRSPEGGRLERQALFGAGFDVLEQSGGMAFGRSDPGGYVGYLEAGALGAWVEPTHRVAVRQTLGFAAPDLKTPGPLALSLGSRVAVTGTQGQFAETAEGLFIPSGHLKPAAQPDPDPVAPAALLLGTPYLWGGNSAFGIDCSGLVQLALLACGIACPGDSDQQETALGPRLAEGTPPRRGDLLFWKGHVAIVSGPGTLLHANGHHMAVAEEPLETALGRIARESGHVTSHIRLTDKE